MNILEPVKLRDYQIPAFEFAMKNDISVLAVAPNGGKTEISICVIEKYLELNQHAKILILTHSTLVLKENYLNRLDSKLVSFKYSDTFAKSASVHVCLPQNIRKIKGKYDFLIVDEAHENYFAKQVQSIITKISPSKQLLLTGTPSKFIKKGGFKLFTLAINAIPPEYFAKLNIELVTSNYNWSKVLNQKLELKEEYRFKRSDTELTLETIVIKLIERLTKKQAAKDFNVPSRLDKIIAKVSNKVSSWFNIYNQLGKTLIVCRSINQAKDVNSILLKHGVNSMISDSKSDSDSSEVKNFLENKYDVLVVIDRARLGYSDDDLYNLIDMSGTHNPDIINQMFSRVLRMKAGDENCSKFYLKVTTQEYGMMDFTHACVCGALMLTDNKYLSTFNGDNFKGMLIPVIKSGSKIGKGSSSSGSSSNKKAVKKLVFPEFTHDVIDVFKNIICDLDKSVSIYKTTTIGEVRDILLGLEKWTEERIIASAMGLL